MRLRIGSRGSQLALWQANHIAGLLRQRGHETAIEIIHTTGDKITDVALAKVGSKGMFIKEIEEALAENRIDLAVHSLKDLPTELSDQFTIAAVPAREDPRDALCSVKFSSIEDLPQAARVGTSSLRREAQLKALRPDLNVHPLRGNVDTRLRKLESGEYDAIILALAGLRRLDRTEFVRQVLPVEVMCPAAGQGALAIEARARDHEVINALLFLDDSAAKLQGGELRLEAAIASLDGKLVLRESVSGSNALRLGELTAEKLLQRGGSAILEAVYAQNPAVPPQP